MDSTIDLDYPILDMDENSDDDELYEIRAPKRYIRNNENPLEFYTDLEFKRRYRFTKDVVRNVILNQIEGALMKPNNRGLPVPPLIQLLVCLRFYATSSFQVVSGDLHFLSQSTISRIVSRVSLLLAALMKNYIKMPVTQAATNGNRRLFQDIGKDRNGIGLPGIDGAIDCTHAVVGPQMQFMDVVTEWPGSAHDSRIFQNSTLYIRYRQRELTGALVGDAGYPSLPFLLTPIGNPANEIEERYNAIHGRTRVVERAFGIFKRFPCLSKGLATKLITTTTIIMACIVLHNISLEVDNAMPEDEDAHEVEEATPITAPHWQPGEGFAFRQALMERMFYNQLQ